MGRWGWAELGSLKGLKNLLKTLSVKPGIHSHLPLGHPYTEREVASSLSALSELWSNISCGLEMPIFVFKDSG